VPRFFSPSRFPDGRHAVGLLVLRAVTAASATYLIGIRAGGSPAGLDILGVALLAASSLAVLVGVLTAGSAALLAAVGLWFLLPFRLEPLVANPVATLLTIADAAIISFLGPGAFSIDARLFGPREIVVPRERP
jgi:hypothetical protein